MQRALVTGCAGFIGSHLTESLLTDGIEVLGIDCFNNNYGRSDKLLNLAHAQDWEGFQFIPLDLAAGDLRPLVEECDVVFHLAAEPGIRASWSERFELYVRNNVLATHQLLQALSDDTSRRLVFASSSSIYGQAEAFPTSETALPRPLSPYGVTKFTGEQLCEAYRANHGLDFVTLRFFSVYGPRQRPDMAFRRFCEAAISSEEITLFGDGTQTRDFTYVGDIVNAARKAAIATAPIGRTINVGGGSSASLLSTVDLLTEIHGGPIAVRRAERQKGDARDTSADTELAALLLDFRSTTRLAEGLASQYAWCRDQRAAAVAA
jgi:UDP-glucuronate 4-epimerase